MKKPKEKTNKTLRNAIIELIDDLQKESEEIQLDLLHAIIGNDYSLCLKHKVQDENIRNLRIRLVIILQNNPR